MAKLNTKGITKVSPAGLGQWVTINEVNQFGKYTTDLVCNPNEDAVREFKAAIDGVLEGVQQEIGKKKARVPYAEDDEGNLVFKTASPEFDSQNEPIKIGLVDSHKTDISGINVGNGSTIKVLVYIMPYDQGANAGVTLRLKKVQVIDLVEYGEDFGDEDGFEADPSDTPKPTTAPVVDEDSDF